MDKYPLLKAHESVEKALYLSQAKYWAIFDSFPIGISITDDKGQIIETNLEAVKLLGLTKSEHKGRYIGGKSWNIIRSDGTQMPDSEFPSVIALKTKKRVENVIMGIVKSDNVITWINVTASPLDIPGFGVVVTYGDISKLKNAEHLLEESERKYRSLFEQMTEGFAFHEIILDKKGRPCDYRFLEINPAFEKLTGLKRGKILGKLITQVLPDDDPKWIRIYGKVALTGKPIHFDNYSPVLKRHYDVYSFSPKKYLFAVLFTDITKRIELERRKDDFINVASHELKTPLTSVKAYAQILQSNIRRKHFSKLEDYSDKMNRQINILQSYINDLLDVNKINAGKLIVRKKRFDIYDLLKDVCEDMQETVEDHDIQLNSIHQNILADKDRITQVLVNLISNASKYSPKNSRILVTASLRKNVVQIDIKDFGIGISREDQKKLFHKFFQADKINRAEKGGLGLGLYISKDIIKQHRGKMWVKSKEGKGSIFYFTLPINTQ